VASIVNVHPHRRLKTAAEFMERDQIAIPIVRTVPIWECRQIRAEEGAGLPQVPYAYGSSTVTCVMRPTGSPLRSATLRMASGVGAS
jgi:hypothetical protein